MSDLECPSCGNLHDFYDLGEPVEQDETLEITCPHCGIEYECEAYYILHFTNERLKTKKAKGEVGE